MTEKQEKQVKSPVQVLREAKYLIQAGWTQGGFASTEPYIVTTDGLTPSYERVPGMFVGEHSPDAKCFCAWGAVNKVKGVFTKQSDPVFAALSVATARRGCYHVPSYNDAAGRTKEEMLSLFDEAIEIAQAMPV